MKKRLISLLLLFALILSLSACTKPQTEPPFEIIFFDVGQGDAALVRCNNKYMMIDTGPNNKSSSEKIRKFLLDNEIYKLEYLVISHWHDDHYGGLKHSALQNVRIKETLCNESPYSKSNLSDVIPSKSKITVPRKGDSFKLGEAEIQVIDVSAKDDNDSLVILITFEGTSFLFTGDIEKEAHSRVADELRSPEILNQLEGNSCLIKLPHHGAYNSDPYLPSNASDNSLATLVAASYAKYFVISVGEDNSYKHPHKETLDIIDQVLNKHELDKSEHLFRTDSNGNITVTSDGTTLTINTEKGN